MKSSQAVLNLPSDAATISWSKAAVAALDGVWAEHIHRNEHRLGEPDDLGSYLHQLLASYVTLGKLLGPSVPQFPSLVKWG